MTSVPPPIPSRTQVVLEEIKRRILTGRLTPGQPLVESELAAAFGVSKTPVREALKTLAGTGLVVMNEYKGVTVRTVDARMAREVYDVRLLLEPEAVRRTVRSGAGLDPARDALARSDAATDTAERSLANRDFHRALYTPCGNPLLARMLDDLRDQAALVAVAAWAAQASWRREAEEHRGILALALAGDADGAAAALHEHVAGFVARAYPPGAAEAPPGATQSPPAGAPAAPGTPTAAPAAPTRRGQGARAASKAARPTAPRAAKPRRTRGKGGNT